MKRFILIFLSLVSVFAFFSCSDTDSSLKAPDWAVGDWQQDGLSVMKIETDGQIFDNITDRPLKLKYNQSYQIDDDVFTLNVRALSKYCFETQLKAVYANSKYPVYIYNKIQQISDDEYTFSTFTSSYGLDVAPLYTKSLRVLKDGIERKKDIAYSISDQLTFESNAAFSIRIDGPTRWDGELFYKTGNPTDTWKVFTGVEVSSAQNKEGKHTIHMRGKGNTYITGNYMHPGFAISYNGLDIHCYGDIRALLDYQAPENTKMAKYAFANLFKGTCIATPPLLPSTTLSEGCYCSMFKDCNRLLKSPILPATALAESCYRSMFQGCKNLEEIPALIADNQADFCYQSMFEGCGKIVLFTELNYDDNMALIPYRITSGSGRNSLLNMFKETGNRYMPATPVGDQTYYSANPVVSKYPTSCLKFESDNKFSLSTSKKCVSWNGRLEYYDIDKQEWKEWNGTEILSSKQGENHYIFLRGSGNTYITGGSKNSFSLQGLSNISCTGDIRTLLNCSKPREAVMMSQAFDSLFKGNALLSSSPSLFSRNLSQSCYAYMFEDCTSLLTPPQLPAPKMAPNCYEGMFRGCSSLKTAPDLPSTELSSSCYAYMFEGCTSLTSIPELKAYMLTVGCYTAMFKDCSSLSSSTPLPAPVLVNDCYKYMFMGCSSLEEIPYLASNPLVPGCYVGMFKGCSKIAVSSMRTQQCPNSIFIAGRPGYSDYHSSKMWECLDEMFDNLSVFSKMNKEIFVSASLAYSAKSPDKITFSDNAITSEVGSVLFLEPLFVPRYSKCNLYWFVEGDKKVASVDENGQVSILDKGVVTICAAAKDNPSIVAKCKVTAIKSPQYIKIAGLNKLPFSKSQPMSVEFVPSDAYNSLKWESSNPSVAKVDGNGNVKALKKGDTTITATTYNGIKSSFELKVVALKPNELTFSSHSASLMVGKTLKCNVKVSPSNSEYSLKYISSNVKVATVNENGTVTAISKGTAVITCESDNGVKDTLNVSVYLPKPSSLTLSHTAIRLKQGDFFSIVPTITPSNAEYTLSFSSDENIVLVDNKGNLEAKNPGSCFVVCKTDNGLSARCTVVVEAKVFSVSEGISDGDESESTPDINDKPKVNVRPVSKPDKSSIQNTLGFDKPGYQLEVGQTMQVAFSRDDIKPSEVLYSISDTDVLEIDNSGKVTAKKAGYVQVRAIGPNFLATCTIIVLGPKPKPSKILLSNSTLSFPLDSSLLPKSNNKDKNSFRLYATIYPKFTGENVEWTSSNSDIASVDADGNVKALQNGYCTITAQTENGVKATCQVSVNPIPTKIYITKSSSLVLSTLEGNNKCCLGVCFFPSGVKNCRVKWSSSNDSIASVNENGVVTAKSPGEVEITASTPNGLKSCISVKVVSDLGFSPNKVLFSGESDVVYVKSLPEGIGSDLKWEVKNITRGHDPVITLSERSVYGDFKVGKEIYANKPGQAKIRVIDKKSGVQSVILVTVGCRIRGEINLLKGQNFELINKDFGFDIPEVFTFSSDNEKIATVDSKGVVTALSKGQCTITAAFGSRGSSCIINVVEDDIALNFPCAYIPLKSEGEPVRLTINNLPESNVPYSLHWASSDESIVEVDNRGYLYPKKTTKNHFVTITVSVRGTSLQAKCYVCVGESRLTDVTFRKDSFIVEKGKTCDLYEELLFNSLSRTMSLRGCLIFSSSDEKIATVDEYGCLKAIADGTAVITAKVGNLPIECKMSIFVGKKVTSITLDKSNITMDKNQSATLKYTIKPSDATYSVVWKSSNSDVVSVDSSGNLTAKHRGTATITACDILSDLKATCNVTVNAVAPTSIKFAYEPISYLNKAETSAFNLPEVIVKPSDADYTLEYTSSRINIATVDNKGKVTLLAENGDFNITVKTDNGLSSTLTFLIDKTFVTPKRISLESKTLYYNYGKDIPDFALYCDLTPKNATTIACDPVATSSDESIVSVEKTSSVCTVYLKAHSKEGTAKISCYLAKLPSVKTEATVTMIECPALDKTTIELTEWSKTAVIGVSKSSNKKLKFESSNTKVATVDSTGKVTAKGPGTATITVKSSRNDGSFEGTATCTVKSDVFDVINKEPDGNYMKFEFAVGTGSQGSVLGSILHLPYCEKMNKNPWNGTMEYYTSQGWKKLEGVSKLNSVIYNGKYCIYLRGSDNTILYNSDGYTEKTFKFNGLFNVFGDICALLNYKDFSKAKMDEACCHGLFSTGFMLTAPTLSIKKLSRYCYSSMFSNCYNLKIPPVLPATTSEIGCYQAMFKNCEALEYIPAIKFKTAHHFDTLTSMFEGAKFSYSLTKTDTCIYEYKIPEAYYEEDDWYLDSGGDYSDMFPLLNSSNNGYDVIGGKTYYVSIPVI